MSNNLGSPWHPKQTLRLLKQMLESIPQCIYSMALPVLSHQSIGAHCRHLLEFYQCLFEGIPNGTICYESRRRDLRLEQDKTVAMDLLNVFNQWQVVEDMPLQLLVDNRGRGNALLSTSLYRELHYAGEHAVHHMALIRIGAEALGFAVPAGFGVASSTKKFQEKCAL